MLCLCLGKTVRKSMELSSGKPALGKLLKDILRFHCLVLHTA